MAVKVTSIWTPGDCITAWKLNSMQNLPQMTMIDEDGFTVGMNDASVSPNDSGTDINIYNGGGVYPKSLGQAIFEYDDDCGRYKVSTYKPNITGAVELVSTAMDPIKYSYKPEKSWKKDEDSQTMACYMREFNEWYNNEDDTSEPPSWCWKKDVQCTSQDNTVINPGCTRLITSTIDQTKGGAGLNQTFSFKTLAQYSSQPFTMFTPDSFGLGSIGVVEGNMGYLKKLHGILGAAKTGCANVLKISNTDNIEVWPLARPVGIQRESMKVIDLGTGDFSKRIKKSHWSQMVDRHVTTGPLIPVLSIGEGGGTFVEHIVNCGNDTHSIAIGAGVEFYDNTTFKECYNSDDPRPQTTRACANLGYGGAVVIESINKDKPWQFKLSTIPIHVPSPGDLGTTADGRPQYSFPDESYLQWPSTPGYASKRTGVLTGEVRRMCNGVVCEGELGEIHKNHQYAVGEIKDGKIGIRTATWRDPNGANPKTASNFSWNRHGGVVVGIENDAPCEGKPFITRDGIIHIPKSIGRCAASTTVLIKKTFSDSFWGVMSEKLQEGNIPMEVIASASSRETSGTDDYHWGQYGLSYRPDELDQFYHDNVPVGMLKPYMASVVPKTTTHINLNGTAGEIVSGVIGIPVARWDPHASGIGDGTNFSPFQVEWNPHGGIIRGIVADIPLKFVQQVAPFIDSWGIIHIYAPFIPECFHVGRFENIDCYFHYTCMYNLCGQVHYHDNWNH